MAMGSEGEGTGEGGLGGPETGDNQRGRLAQQV